MTDANPNPETEAASSPALQTTYEGCQPHCADENAASVYATQPNQAQWIDMTAGGQHAEPNGIQTYMSGDGLFPQATHGPPVHLPLGMSPWHYEQPPSSFWNQCTGAMSNCCQAPSQPPIGEHFDAGRGYGEDEQLWRWTRDGKLQLTCGQPIVPVPVIQEVHRRDKIIEVPHVDVLDAVKPKVFNQGVQHEIPVMHIEAQREDFEVKQVKYVETEVLVPVVTGFTHKFMPKWEIREVPRPVVKYVGRQEEIEVEVPQVKFVDRVVEREVVVDTIEKRVPKIIEEHKYVDTVKYVWKPVEKIIHVERFVPVFDVSLECPAPLIVPYPVQAVKELPAVLVRKQLPGGTGEEPGTDEQSLEIASPSGTIRVPEEYIRDYKHAPADGIQAIPLCGSICSPSQEEQQRRHEAAAAAATGKAPANSLSQSCCPSAPAGRIYLTADEMKRLRGSPEFADIIRIGEHSEEAKVEPSVEDCASNYLVSPDTLLDAGIGDSSLETDHAYHYHDEPCQRVCKDGGDL